jgi:O-antigen/teichoic acid export membrane protein
MSRLAQRIKLWINDPLLQRLLRNSGYLFSGSAITLLLNMGQSILASQMLGMAGFGLLGTITQFSSTINRLFSFRMGELVVKYLGADLAENRRDRAGALVKAAALTEAATSLLAFGAVMLLAAPAALWLGKDPATKSWFILYSFSILGNLVCETATGVLQIGGHFRSQAVINIGQSALTALIILGAFFTHGNMLIILVAYLVGKVILGTAPAVLAFIRLNSLLGAGWWRAPFSLLPPLRQLFGFAANTNLSATINLLVRDSEVLWISLFMGNEQAGYYKVALAIINLVTVPITPLISTTYPEISKVAALKDWPRMRWMLRRMTALSGGYSLLTGLGLALLGPWLVTWYGADAGPAYPALLILLLGYGAANTLYWNRHLLLSTGRASVPTVVSAVFGFAKVALVFWIVPAFGYIGEAWLLSGYFLASNLLLTWLGLHAVRKAEVNQPQGEVQ